MQTVTCEALTRGKTNRTAKELPITDKNFTLGVHT